MDPFLHATIGEYRIASLLGEGGMGRVYRAQHHRLGRDAAVKVLTTAANDPVFLQRFLNEAQIQSRLRDPGIASLYDFTEFQGSPVMIMEFIDGETLQEITRRVGHWTPDQAIPVLAECARTLEYVHAQGIIHRDLKSANVKMSSRGELKLLDFGIAIPATGRTMQRLTTAGFVIGTFQSLAPEQVRGEGASQASDIWSFGVLAYEMLTGSLPFEAGSAGELFAKISRAHFTSPSVLRLGIPKALDAVVCRCLKRDPKDRYSSFAEVRADLERLRPTGRRASGSAVAEMGKGPGGGWRRPAIAAGVAVVVLGGAFGVYEMAHNGSGQSDGAPVHTTPADNAESPPVSEPPPPAATKQAAAVNDERGASTGAAAGAVKAVTIDVFDGSAEVWRDGRRLGSTPFTVQEPYGRTVQLTLKQPGFRDMPVQFDVGERASYSYEMQRSANP